MNIFRLPLRLLASASKRARFYRWLWDARQQQSLVHAKVTIDGNHLDPFGAIQLGRYCLIERDVSITLLAGDGADARLTLADKVFIGRNTFLAVYQPIEIGAHCMIGAYSYIVSNNHNYARRDIPMMEQGFSGAPIVIEDDVWLGTHVVVLPGVRIGRGAIVAAGSIVNKDIPPFQIWGGAPAKFIKERPA